MMPIRNRVGGLVAAAIIMLLAGCSGGGGDDAGGSTASDQVATGSGAALTRGAAEKGAEQGAEPAPDAGDGAALRSGAQVVRTAGQTVRVDDVRAAAARARTAATALGGYVAAENLYLGDPGQGAPEPIDDRTRTPSSLSSLTLRVPEKSTDTALDRLAGLGKELNRTSTADDVTAQVADLDSRVKTQERSLARVRALLDRAGSLKDVVLLESELSRREEELEAGQARSRALRDQAALATIDLELVGDDSPLPAGEDDGFLHGLAEGWDALGRSTVAVLTGIGAVLPFAVVVGLIATPAFLAWRRRTTARQAPAVTSSPTPDQP